MAEIEGVTGLVTGGLSRIFRVTTAELRGENEAGRVAVPGERVQVGDTARPCSIPIVAAPADADAHTEVEIGGGRFA